MSQLDRLAILEQANTWCQQGQNVWLFHVLRTWGSSPRPIGSLMAMNDTGEQAGSVSGGCVEADLQRRRDEISKKNIQIIEYDDTSTSIHLPCGGQLQLLIELVTLEQLEPLIQAYRGQTLLLRRININNGKITFASATPNHEELYRDGDTVYETYGRQWSLLLIGAEHLAALLSRIALTLEYRIIVCEPREEKRSQWQEPDTLVTELMPDDAVKQYTNDHCAVLTLSHDPRLDDMALMEALNSDAFYIGALGSKRSNERRQQQLKSMGLTNAQLQKLDAPIGLDIGSRSAAEIAISIAARLVQVRSAMRKT